MTVPYVEQRGHGPDVVLLHGWALHGGMWGPWLDRLAEHARLHVVDLPGHGRSAWPADVTDLAGLARHVAPVVPPGAAVIGWSLGGMLALELARQQPSRVGPLVLIATTPRFVAGDDWGHGTAPDVLDGFARGLASDYDRTIRMFLALQTLGDDQAAQALRGLRATLLEHGPPDPRALEAGLQVLRAADLRDALPGIANPALVISGARDRLTPPEAGRGLASRLPAARYSLVPGAGHAPFFTHADDVVREIVPFLGRHLRREEPPPEIEADALVPEHEVVRSSFSRAAATYDAAAVLQARVRDELLDRLDVVRLVPEVVVDLGTGTGHAAAALRRRYRKSRVVAVDLAEGMLVESGRRTTLLRRFDRIGGDAAALPLRDASVDLIFSNLMLQWCPDTDAVFRECRRVLRPGGLLSFTTLGPDTLVELRRAWAAADPGRVHVNSFLDMHDLGDALGRAGLAEPVMDVERYTLTYDSARELMRDLKAIGAHNAAHGRPRGLTGPRTLARMIDAYDQERRDGCLPATYEVVFGHAWSPVSSDRSATGDPREVRVPLSRLGRRR